MVAILRCNAAHCVLAIVFSTLTVESADGQTIDFTWTRMFADGKVAFQATYGTLFAGGYLTSTLNQQVNQHWAYLSLWMNF